MARDGGERVERIKNGVFRRFICMGKRYCVRRSVGGRAENIINKYIDSRGAVGRCVYGKTAGAR